MRKCCSISKVGSLPAKALTSERLTARYSRASGFPSAATMTSSAAMFDRHGWLIVFVSTISPLSAKLTCIAAGAFGLPFVEFLPMLVLGRVIRFGVLAILLRFAGERIAIRLAARRARG